MPMGRLVLGARARGRPLNQRQFRQVKKLIDANKQFKVLQLNDQVLSTQTGSLVEVTNITEGDDYNQRLTDRIQMKRFHLNFAIRGSVDDFNGIRVMLVRAKQGKLAIGDMPAIDGAPDLDKMQIYYDKVFYVVNTSNKAHFARGTIIKKFARGKIPGINVLYDDSIPGTGAEDNALYFYHVSDSAAPADPEILYTGELTFIDRN